jgi:hypothetical protein
MRVFLICLFSFSLFASASAQEYRRTPQRIHLGVFGGVSNYLGSQRSSPHGAVGGYVAYDATGYFSVRAQVAYTKLNGESSIIYPGFVMRLFEGDILGEYNFLNLYKSKNRFTLYLTGGIGLTGNLNLDSEENDGTSVIVPLGGGGKFLMGKNAQLRVEYQHRLPVGISSNTSNNKFESYGLVQIGVSIRMSALLSPGRYE